VARAEPASPAAIGYSRQPPSVPPASNQRPLESAPERSEPATRWYGWQIVPIDAVALSVIVAELALGERATPAPGILALGAYALGGPVVHLAHGRSSTALGSVALRLALPAIGALVGSSLENCENDSCTGGVPTVYGGLAGAVPAMVLDSALLARAPLPVTASLSLPIGRQSLRVAVSGRF
jgi:hypothetical protein